MVQGLLELSENGSALTIEAFADVDVVHTQLEDQLDRSVGDLLRNATDL